VDRLSESGDGDSGEFSQLTHYQRFMKSKSKARGMLESPLRGQRAPFISRDYIYECYQMYLNVIKGNKKTLGFV
jgi:hypothetical protein